MLEYEDIVGQATPNFLLNFLNRPTSDESISFSEKGVSLICIGEKCSTERKVFIKVLDGTYPPEYYGFVLYDASKDSSQNVSFEKCLINISDLSIITCANKYFILTKKINILTKFPDINFGEITKKFNLKNVIISTSKESSSFQASPSKLPSPNTMNRQLLGDQKNGSDEGEKSSYGPTGMPNEDLAGGDNRGLNSKFGINDYVSMCKEEGLIQDPPVHSAVGSSSPVEYTQGAPRRRTSHSSDDASTNCYAHSTTGIPRNGMSIDDRNRRMYNGNSNVREVEFDAQFSSHNYEGVIGREVESRSHVRETFCTRNSQLHGTKQTYEEIIQQHPLMSDAKSEEERNLQAYMKNVIPANSMYRHSDEPIAKGKISLKESKSDGLLNEKNKETGLPETRYTSIYHEEMSCSSRQMDLSDRNAKPSNYDGTLFPTGSLNENEMPLDSNEGEKGRGMSKMMKERTITRANRKVAPYQNKPVMKITDETYMAIKSLSVYASNWVIRARVGSKSSIRKYPSQNNNNKSGQVFNAELYDEDGEIKCSFFNKAVDKWYDYIKEGHVYRFAKGLVKTANRKFNTLNHSCEITLDENSIIELVEENENIPRIVYNFRPLGEIKNINVGSVIDVAAVVVKCNDATNVLVKKTNEYIDKRDIILVDESNELITLTMWGESATKVNEGALKNYPVLCLKNVKVGEWQIKKLESNIRTKIEMNPDIEKTHVLKEWWFHNNKKILDIIRTTGAVPKFETTKTIRDMKSEAYDGAKDILAGKGMYFLIFGFIDRIFNAPPVYPACPECNKKMTVIEEAEHEDEEDMRFGQDDPKLMWCQKCTKNNYPSYNYLFNIRITDDSDSITVSLFDNCAKIIMNGMTANEYMKLQREDEIKNQGEHSRVLKNIQDREAYFKIRVNVSSVMDEIRTNFTVVEIIPFQNVVVESSKYLINHFYKSISANSRDLNESVDERITQGSVSRAPSRRTMDTYHDRF